MLNYNTHPSHYYATTHWCMHSCVCVCECVLCFLLYTMLQHIDAYILIFYLFIFIFMGWTELPHYPDSLMIQHFDACILICTFFVIPISMMVSAIHMWYYYLIIMVALSAKTMDYRNYYYNHSIIYLELNNSSTWTTNLVGVSWIPHVRGLGV